MLRAMIPAVLVLTFSLINVGNSALAFTLRFGAVPVAEDPIAIHGGVNRDIPTPRMFNTLVTTSSATFGPPSSSTDEIIPVLPIRLRRNTPTAVAAAKAPAPARRGAMPRHLSGVEIILLRGAKQMAKR